MVIFKVQW